MLGFLPNLGFSELLLILAVALIVVGPGKLPEVGKSLGKTFQEFKRATDAVKDDITGVLKDEGDNKEKK